MNSPAPKYPTFKLPFSRAITHFYVFLLIILALQSALPLSIFAEQPPRKPKILILYGRSTNLPANKIINEGMLPALNVAGVNDADLFQEYLDFQHHPKHKYRLELAAYMRKKYVDERFDVIITCYQDAFDFMIREGKELFKDTPIVAAVSKNTVLASNGGRKVIQIVYSLDALSTLRYALNLLPETKEIIVISGPNKDDYPYLESTLEAVKKLKGKLNILYLSNHPMSEILKEVARERDHAIILYTRLLKDSEEKMYLPPKALSDISRVSKSPVFGLYNSLLGAGIVGGNLLSYEDLGKEAARVAVDLINNKIDAQKATVFYLKHTPMFDWAEMKRWGLDKSRLPKESILINYRPGFWAEYWGYALIALIFVIGEAVLIAYLAWSRRKRLQAEEELRTNEGLLRSYLDNTAIISWMKDEDGRHIFRNETFGKRFAPQSEKWQGKTDFELWPQELAEEYQRNDQIVLRNGQPFEITEKAIDPDGTFSWWLTTKFPFQDAAGKRFVGGLGVDITELRQAEDAIELKQAQMLNIINATDVMLVYLDPEFNFVEVNNAYASTCRMTPEAMIGKNHFALYPDQETEAIFRQVRDSSVPVFIKDRPFEFPDQPERGVTYWNWSLIPVKDAEGHIIGLVFSLLETTERKQAEEALRSANERLKLAQQAAGAGVWGWDITTGYIEWSPELFTLFGLDQDKERPGFDLWCEVLHPDDRQAASERIERAVREGSFLDSEYRILLPNGAIRWINARGRTFYDPEGEPLRMLGICIDITRRRQAEESLRRSEDRYRTLVELSPDAILINLNNQIVFMNPAAVRLFGASSSEQILGKSPYDLIYPDCLETIRKRLARLPEGEAVSLVEEKILRLDGTLVDVEVAAAPFTMEEGTAIQVILRDITERKRSADALAAAKEQAEAANRAKSEFLANMSHEIRSPMNGIMGMTQLLEHTTLSDEQSEYLETIRSSSHGLLSLINDILDLSKIESGKIELERKTFHLRSTIEDVIRTQLTLIHDKGLSLEIDISDEVPDNLVGDQLRLKQILLNLLGNAIKFTERGGIRISAVVIERHDDIALLKIDVIDTGIGINPEIINKIFKPFTQADASTTRKYGGTGLGLSICRRLVELMKGKILVESKEGVGSTFSLQAPFVVGQTAEERPEHRSTYRGRPVWDGPPLRILLVDDYEINLVGTTRLLQKYGHTVVQARNGAEAIQKWEQETFDAILMDIQMPIMNGIEAAKSIRLKELGSDRHVPTIALTGRAFREEQDEILSHGFDGYISKPIELSQLFKEMRRCLPPDLTTSV